MSARTANCPNCGAPIQFRWSSAVQTTCEFCHSILVRHDVDLTKVGEVADLPADSSPIQIATEGIYRNKAFQVVGRILYEYEQGGWNEWHIVFSDGASGWLSDAQDEYAVSFQATPPEPLPPADQVERGQKALWNGVRYEVTCLTRARYRGVEGELPFEYWDKADRLFVDLRAADGRFATIDYSHTEPLLFLGEAVEFDDLHLKNARQFEGWS
ncbi:MAG: DUF4178 domain-containing protein [Acidobacteria bacterium]|nr:DUF4178 domain-containing protein [Acidobacteriota bacterium]